MSHAARLTVTLAGVLAVMTLSAPGVGAQPAANLPNPLLRGFRPHFLRFDMIFVASSCSNIQGRLRL